jgi:hypothetical protein
MGALTHPVLDALELSWWNSQGDLKNVTQMAMAELARRRLFDPATVRPSQQLGLIIAARSTPAFIIVSRENPDAEARAERYYGLADDYGVHSMLVEHIRPNRNGWNGPAHHFELTTNFEPHADVIAEFAAARKLRTVDLYLPNASGTRIAERLVLKPLRRHMVHMDRQDSGALVLDQAHLARLIAGMMHNGILPLQPLGKERISRPAKI